MRKGYALFEQMLKRGGSRDGVGACTSRASTCLSTGKTCCACPEVCVCVLKSGGKLSILEASKRKSPNAANNTCDVYRGIYMQVAYVLMIPVNNL